MGVEHSTRKPARRLRVAMVAPPFVKVPPDSYGGTELIIAELIDGLIERGADVTLYASGDSRGGFLDRCEVRSLYASARWPPSSRIEQEHVAFAATDIAHRRNEFDLVHSHVPSFVQMSRGLQLPIVHSIHHDLQPTLCAAYQLHPEIEYVAISHRQRELCGPFPRSHVVHHGLDPSRFRCAASLRDDCGVAYISRLSRCKGPHLAIDVARAAGLRIQLGGLPHVPEDSAFFDDYVEWRLQSDHVIWYGEVDHMRKTAMLANSRALLFPIEWEEPFGLVIIEAMLSGCPVVAFGRGAAPELIEEGITGFIARDEHEMVEILRGPAHPARFDRERCRRRAICRFSSDRMVNDYLKVYLAAIQNQWLPVTAAEGAQANTHA